MKNNPAFDALTDIDDDLILEAQTVSSAQKRPKRWLLALAAAAAVLLLAAGAIGGAALLRGPGVPLQSTEQPKDSKTDAPRYFIQDAPEFLQDDTAFEPRYEYVGLRVIPGENPRLILRENASLFLVHDERPSSCGELREALARYYPSGDAGNGKIYFPGRITGCLETGYELEKSGIFVLDAERGKVSALILSKSAITNCALCKNVLYFAEYGETKTVRMTDEHGGSWQEERRSLDLYAADLDSGEITLFARTDARGTSRTFFTAREDGLWMLATDYTEEFLLQISASGDQRRIDLPEKALDACFIGDALYAYDSAASNSRLWKLEGDSFSLLYDNERPWLLLGAAMDRPALYDGQLVLVRDHTLLLHDPETGKETILQNDVVLTEDPVEGDLPNRYSKIVYAGRLYFYDYEANTLSLFQGDRLLRTIAL